MSSLRSLTNLMPPPKTPVDAWNAGGWQIIESKIGTNLPEDYKEFVGCYGTGAIDHFLWPLNPFSSTPHLNLIDEGQAKLEALAELQYEHIPYSLYPDSNGILPWGVTDNGDVLYWACNGPPSKWPIVVNESRGPRWREFRLSTTEFLKKLVAGELTVDVFPEDFPSQSPAFIPIA